MPLFFYRRVNGIGNEKEWQFQNWIFFDYMELFLYCLSSSKRRSSAVADNFVDSFWCKNMALVTVQKHQGRGKKAFASFLSFNGLGCFSFYIAYTGCGRLQFSFIPSCLCSSFGTFCVQICQLFEALHSTLVNRPAKTIFDFALFSMPKGSKLLNSYRFQKYFDLKH